MSSLLPTTGLGKIAAALPAALGKTVAGVFLAEYSRQRWRLIVVFDDGTHYELYGEGAIEGSRMLERGDVDDVRRWMMDAAATRTIEVSAAPIGQARRER